jgi:Rrf2 family protein
MSLRLTRASEYAIRAMIHIGSIPDGTAAQATEIAFRSEVPPSFAGKILNKLARGGILKSTRGIGGGYALAKPADAITLLDILEAIEGPIALTDCAPDPDNCNLSHDCPASVVWLQVQRRFSAMLAETTVESLVATPRRNKQVVYQIKR